MTIFLVLSFYWALTVMPTTVPMLNIALICFQGWLGGGYCRPKKLAWLAVAWVVSLACIASVLCVAFLSLPLRPQLPLVLWLNGAVFIGCLVMAWGMVRDAVGQTHELIRYGEAPKLRIVRFEKDWKS